MILVAGEALIDIVNNNANTTEFTAIMGGSAYNVACALGILETQPTFACPISTDSFGDLLLKGLEKHGVSVGLTPRVSAPTPLAIVNFTADNQPSYSFYRQGTADRAIDQFALKDAVAKKTKMLHITGFCLNEADDYTHWVKLVHAVKDNNGIISVDPNVRAGLITNEEEYRERIQSLMALAHVVKVSDEDLAYLYPNITPEDAKQELASRTQLAIITLGSQGAEAFWNEQRISVSSFGLSELVDTVGAGDCFSAAYLYGLHTLAITKPTEIADLSPDQLSSLLTFASAAAAINCGRKGCQPPSISEINVFLKKQ